MSSTDLIGYAVLRANFDARRGSYIDNFSEFALYALAKRKRPASPTQVATQIHADFGLTIPDQVVKKLLDRGVRARKVNRIGSQSGTYQILPSSDFKSLESAVLRFNREQSDLIQAFQDYVKIHHSAHTELIGLAVADDLTAYVERNAGAVLSHVTQGRSDLKSGSMRGIDYLISSFIEHISTVDSHRFDLLTRLVQGVVIASMVNLGSYQPKARLKSTEFFLDTPIVLAALGLKGQESEHSIGQALALAKGLGAQLCIFEHTRSESQNVLRNVAEALRGARHSTGRDVEMYFLENDLSSSDAIIRAEHIDRDLGSLGIAVKDTPEFIPRIQLDEEALETELEMIAPSQSPDAKYRDIKSLAAIHRLRHGKITHDFERCTAFLVTNNTAVVKVSGGVDNGQGWPLAISDSDLVNLLWLKNPNAAEGISQQQLIAVAHAGMRPPEGMWIRYLDEIERLQKSGDVDPEVAAYLRAEPSVPRLLMEETAGSLNVDGTTVAAVKRSLEKRVAQPLREDIERIKDDLEESESERLAASQAAQRERKERDKESSRSISLEQTVTMYRERDRETEAREKRAVHRMIRALHSVAFLGFVLLAAIAYFSPKNIGPAWLYGTCGFLVFGVGNVCTVFGVNSRWLILRLERFLVRRRLRRLGIPVGGADLKG